MCMCVWGGGGGARMGARTRLFARACGVGDVRHVARMFGVSTTITYDMFIADVVGGTAAIRPGFRGALYTFPPKRFSVAMNIALGTQELQY